MTLYAIGDIQGCARTFDTLLRRIRFKPARDQLWLVGDLVNRGPDSAEVLRMVRALGDSATTVLGNHDLHLLATAAGIRRISNTDTFNDVLDARDAHKLLDWLRQQPLLVRDRHAKRILVHAGLPPVWKTREAEQAAAEVEEQLAGRSWRKSLRGMYGNVPARWSHKLAASDRRRFTINGLTRMRYCTRTGGLDFRYSGPPGTQPKSLVPWFDFPGRHGRKWNIVFGHWSALGVVTRENLTATDSGCVWGRELTAVPLDSDRPPVAVECCD